MPGFWYRRALVYSLMVKYAYHLVKKTYIIRVTGWFGKIEIDMYRLFQSRHIEDYVKIYVSIQESKVYKSNSNVCTLTKSRMTYITLVRFYTLKDNCIFLEYIHCFMYLVSPCVSI